MIKFIETAEGRDFIAGTDICKTSRDVMTTIAFFARDKAEAWAIWNGNAINTACTLLDIWENATSNGTAHANLCWGSRAARWATEFEG